MAHFDYYFNEETNEVITYDQYRQLAIDYINKGAWETECKPTIAEVMENMDYITRYEEEA